MMEVETMVFLAVVSLLTRIEFEVIRMVLLFLPSMTEFALILVLASSFVRSDELLACPFLALLL